MAIGEIYAAVKLEVLSPKGWSAGKKGLLPRAQAGAGLAFIGTPWVLKPYPRG